MAGIPGNRTRLYGPVMLLLLLVILYPVAAYNYLLFHSLTELYSIIIACSLFLFAWNTRDYGENRGLVQLGIAYLFVAVLDLMHTLSYSGMGIFTDYDFYANQIWLAARAMESLSLLFFSTAFSGKTRPGYTFFFSFHALLTGAVLFSIFVIKVFPVCFIPGTGQTDFKIYAEWTVMGILLLALLLFSRKRSYSDPSVYRYLSFSILLTLAAEFSFTMYVSNYGPSNMLGHYLKITSFYLVYKAIIETGLREPLSVMFRRLKKNEEELGEANEFKDKLFSIIGHDLKGSIGGMASLSALIVEDFNSISPEKHKSYLQEMQKASTQSLKLLENLLAWGSSRSGGHIEEAFKAVPVSEIISSAMETMSISAESKSISIGAGNSADLFFLGDRNMVETVLRNLLSNAIKYTPRGGSVHIDSGKVSGADAEEVIEISVADTGMGMSEKQLNSLFQIGRRNSIAGTEHEKGSGFGLILCRELVEKNKGALSISSTEGKGTRVSVTLPAVPPA
jgi:signal transduction histidine kinase